MDNDAGNNRKRLSSGPEARQRESSEQSKAHKTDGETAEAFPSSIQELMLLILLSLIGIAACIAATVGYVLLFKVVFADMWSSEPRAALGMGIVSLSVRVFMWAPVYVFWRKQREYYAGMLFVLIVLLFPYCSIGFYALSWKDIATMETMTLLLNCSFSFANIFALPVYVIYIRNGAVEESDSDFNDKRTTPTLAEVVTYATPLCIYYALISMCAVAVTASVHFGKIESMMLLYALAIVSWTSFLGFYPLHYSRTVNCRRWLSIFFLVLVPFAATVVFLMDKYEICALDSILTPMYHLQGFMWAVLILVWLGRSLVSERARKQGKKIEKKTEQSASNA